MSPAGLVVAVWAWLISPAGVVLGAVVCTAVWVVVLVLERRERRAAAEHRAVMLVARADKRLAPAHVRPGVPARAA